MKKFRLYRNVAALALVGTMTAGMLTGCNNKSFLDGTVLEDTRVISFNDGHKDIAKIYDTCSGKFHHYDSIVTDENFSGKDCTGNVRNKYDITSDESIISYLTTDEIVKASKNELTEDDISNIISRIFTKTEEQKLYKK